MKTIFILTLIRFLFQHVVATNCDASCSSCQNNVCIACFSGFYLENSACQQCSPTCKTCSTYDSCQSCNSNDHRKLEGSKCPCKPAWMDYGIAKCSKWDNTQNRENGGSYACLKGYGGSDIICKACIVLNCATCPNVQVCDTCDSSKNFQINPLKNNCICSIGYYLTNNTCQGCDSTCLTCDGPTKTNCVSCSNQNIQPKNGQCETPTCQEKCQTCDQSSQCLECKPTLVLNLDHQCLCKDANNYYDSQGQVCKACSQFCETCQSEKICLTCMQGYSLFGTQIIMCQLKIVQPKECGKGCSACSNGLGCLECNIQDHWQLGTQNNSAICQCIPGYYESIEKTCSLCHSTCETCFGSTATSCLTCYPTQNRIINLKKACQCVFPTEESIDGQCKIRCSQNCATCEQSKNDNCLSCDSTLNLILLGTTCTCKPSDYFVSNSGQCQPCNETCKECTGSTQFECLECHEDQKRILKKSQCICQMGHFEQNNQCIESCPVGFYPDENQNLCRPCHLSCITCSGEGIQGCSECKEKMNVIPQILGPSMDVYLSDLPQIFQGQIRLFDCKSLQNIKATQPQPNKFQLQWSLVTAQGYPIISTISDYVGLNVFEIPEKTCNFGQYTLTLTAIEIDTSKSYTTSQKLKFYQFEERVQIIGGDRVIGYQQTLEVSAKKINLRVSNIPFNIQENNLIRWSCLDLARQGPCTNQLGIQLYLNSSSLLRFERFVLQPYSALNFTIQVKEENGSVTLQDSAIVGVVEDFIPQLTLKFSPYLQIHPININEDIDICYELDGQTNSDLYQYSANMIYNYEIVTTKIYEYKCIRFRVQEYFSKFTEEKGGSIYFKAFMFNPMYAMPAKLSLNLQVNIPPIDCRISSSPESGFELEQVFTLTTSDCKDTNQPLQYRYYYYIQQVDLDHDAQSGRALKGIALNDFTEESTYLTKLPSSGISNDITIMVEIRDANGGISNTTTVVLIHNKKTLSSQTILQDLTQPIIIEDKLSLLQILCQRISKQQFQHDLQSSLLKTIISIQSQILADRLNVLLNELTIINSRRYLYPMNPRQQSIYDTQIIQLNRICSIIAQISYAESQTHKKHTRNLVQTNQSDTLELIQKVSFAYMKSSIPNFQPDAFISEKFNLSNYLLTAFGLIKLLHYDVINQQTVGLLEDPKLDTGTPQEEYFSYRAISLLNYPLGKRDGFPYANQTGQLKYLGIKRQSKGEFDIQEDQRDCIELQKNVTIDFKNHSQKKKRKRKSTKSVSEVCISEHQPGYWESSQCTTQKSNNSVSCECRELSYYSVIQDVNGIFTQHSNQNPFSEQAFDHAFSFEWYSAAITYIFGTLTLSFMAILIWGYFKDKVDSNQVHPATTMCISQGNGPISTDFARIHKRSSKILDNRTESPMNGKEKQYEASICVQQPESPKTQKCDQISKQIGQAKSLNSKDVSTIIKFDAPEGSINSSTVYNRFSKYLIVFTLQIFQENHQLTNPLFAFNKDLSRPLRACILYSTMILGLGVTVYFGGRLNIVRSIVISLVGGCLNSLTRNLYIKLIGSKKQHIKLIGSSIFFIINLFCIYIIMVTISSVTSSDQVNSWTIQYSISIGFENGILQIAELLVKYQMARNIVKGISI